MKCMFFLATEKGYSVLNYLISNNLKDNIGCVVTFSEINVVKNWQNDIRQLCYANNIQTYIWKEVKDNLEEIISSHSVNSAIAISWRFLIPLSINKLLENDLIVFHDSLLPKYRGFAPTPTAIICGEEVIGVTALFASEYVDEGRIILQREMRIEQNAYIKEIIKEQSNLYAQMVEELIHLIENDNIQAHEQDHSKATYSIWRNVEDCHIDWKCSALEIFNFIRALGEPYHGAFSILNGEKIIIKTTDVLKDDFDFAIRQPGKIWSISSGVPTIVCGKGLLLITNAVKEDGSNVIFDKLRVQLK